MKKIKINSDDFAKSLEPLQSVINPSHIVPILQCVNIQSDSKRIYVIGDNHEVRCKNSLKLDTGVDFDICIEFQLLLAALKNLKKQEIEIEIKTASIKISHQNGDFDIPLEDVSAFPTIKKEKLSSQASIDVKSFKKSLKVANRFLLNEDLEPMSNLSIEIGKKKTVIRSTNKASLFQEKIKGGGEKANILISGKTSSSIHALLEDENEEVLIQYNDSKIFFSFGEKEVMAIQQQGAFPLDMFNKIIDSIDADSFDINVDNVAFVTALKRVSSLSMKEKSQRVKMTLSKKNLNLSCDNEISSSKVHEDLPVKFKGGDKVIGFNAKILIEVLSVFDNDSIFKINKSNCFCIKTKKTAGLIAPVLLDK